MKLYTEKQMRELVKSFTDFCDANNYPMCNYQTPDLEPIEVELLGQVKDEQEGNRSFPHEVKIILKDEE